MTTPDRTRAAALLGLPADAAPAAVRAAVLGKLAAEDFTPPEEWAAAANALAGAEVPVTPDADEAAAAELREDLDAFAAAYWSLTPAERLARWESLTARGPTGADAKFLTRLAAGLAAIAAGTPDAETAELAGLVRELFVLRPRARAVRLAELGGGRGPAADRLAAADPALAALDPAALDRLRKGVEAVVPSMDRGTDPWGGVRLSAAAPGGSPSMDRPAETYFVGGGGAPPWSTDTDDRSRWSERPRRWSSECACTDPAAPVCQAGACVCQPQGCNDRCGSVDDGCGGTLDCGVCCQPRTICAAGECGQVGDGCGGLLTCPVCQQAVPTQATSPTQVASPTPVPSSRYLLLLDSFGSSSMLDAAGERDANNHGMRDAFAQIVDRLKADDPTMNVIYFSYRAGRQVARGQDPMRVWAGGDGYANAGEPLHFAADLTDRRITEHTAGLDWLIRDVLTKHPEAELDVIGFGLGGIVTLAWIAELLAAGDEARLEVVQAVKHVALVNAPLGGVHPAIDRSPELRAELQWHNLDLGNARVLRELATDADFVAGLESAATRVSAASIESASDYLVNQHRVPGLAIWLDTAGLGIWLGRGPGDIVPSDRAFTSDLEDGSGDLLRAHRSILSGNDATAPAHERLANFLAP